MGVSSEFCRCLREASRHRKEEVQSHWGWSMGEGDQVLLEQKIEQMCEIECVRARGVRKGCTDHRPLSAAAKTTFELNLGAMVSFARRSVFA